MKQSEAEMVLDYIREALAKGTPPEILEQELQSKFNIVPLKLCDGEAHSSMVATEDTCQCFPRWGLVGNAIKIV